MDLYYLVAYALLVLPLVTLLGAGSATALARHARWAVLPALPGASRWLVLLLGLLLFDAPGRRRLLRLFAVQWLEPFVNARRTTP